MYEAAGSVRRTGRLFRVTSPPPLHSDPQCWRMPAEGGVRPKIACQQEARALASHTPGGCRQCSVSAIMHRNETLIFILFYL
jgi:hypothetical protein